MQKIIGLARALRAQAAVVRSSRPELEVLSNVFAEVYGQPPDTAQRAVLAGLSTHTSNLTSAQRYRRVLASFDQLHVKTSFTVRWGGEDLQVVEVEGVRMHLDRADVSVSDPLARGVYERHLTAFFRRFLREGMHVIDAGANVGLYSILAAKLVGPTGKVWSFEPNSENARLLLVSALDHGLENIKFHPVALGNAHGHTCFTSALGSNGSVVQQGLQDLKHASCKIVPIARLDDYGIERVDLLKMDVEGAEGLLVQGAEGLITRCRPVVTAEFSNEMLSRISGISGAEFLRFFTERGYRVSVFNKRTLDLVPIEDTDAFSAKFVGTVRIEDLVMTPAGAT